MNDFYLSIAGITTRVTCSSTAVIDLLANRFGGFVLDLAEKPFEIHIQVEEYTQHHFHVSPVFTFDHHRIHFDLPGYVGYVDPGKSAFLRIASESPADGIEYFLRVVYAALSHQEGGLMVHGAGVVRNDRAYLFFGHSGSGKTTAAKNSSDGLVLNDDLIILLPHNDRWHAHGTPFTNPTQTRPSNRSAPLAAVLRLVQSPEVFLKPLEGAHAIAEFVASAPVLNASPEPPLLRCRQILDQVPAYKLYLRPDPSFWELIENI